LSASALALALAIGPRAPWARARRSVPGLASLPPYRRTFLAVGAELLYRTVRYSTRFSMLSTKFEPWWSASAIKVCLAAWVSLYCGTHIWFGIGSFWKWCHWNPVWDDVNPVHEPLIAKKATSMVWCLVIVFCQVPMGTVPERRLDTGVWCLRSVVPIIPGCQVDPLPLPCRLKRCL